jgi:hypothetical protein
MWNLILGHLGTMLVLVQGWSTVFTEHTMGIKIVLDELDGTPR